jgi:hypothetical protein
MEGGDHTNHDCRDLPNGRNYVREHFAFEWMYDSLFLGANGERSCGGTVLGAGVVVGVVLVDTGGGGAGDLSRVVDDAGGCGRGCG